MKHTLIAVVVLLTLTTRLPAQDIPLSQILVEKEDWKLVGKAPFKVTTMFADENGSIALVHEGEKQNYVARLRTNGQIDQELPPNPEKTKLPLGVNTRAGAKYFVDPEKKMVVSLVGDKREPLKLNGLSAPSCVTAWPDEGHLVIGESSGAWLWAVRIEENGSLGPGDRYYSLRTKPGEPTKVTAMTLDAKSLLYASTSLGVQVFDPTGRLCGVVSAPAKEEMTAITIGGEKADTLYVACGDKIYSRKIQGKAAYTLKKDK